MASADYISRRIRRLEADLDTYRQCGVPDADRRVAFARRDLARYRAALESAGGEPPRRERGRPAGAITLTAVRQGITAALTDDQLRRILAITQETPPDGES